MCFHLCWVCLSVSGRWTTATCCSVPPRLLPLSFHVAQIVSTGCNVKSHFVFVRRLHKSVTECILFRLILGCRSTTDRYLTDCDELRTPEVFPGCVSPRVRPSSAAEEESGFFGENHAARDSNTVRLGGCYHCAMCEGTICLVLSDTICLCFI